MLAFHQVLVFLSLIYKISGKTCPCATLDTCAASSRAQQQQTASSCKTSCASFYLTTLHGNLASNIQLCYANAENQLFDITSAYNTCLGPSGRGCSSPTTGPNGNENGSNQPIKIEIHLNLQGVGQCPESQPIFGGNCLNGKCVEGYICLNNTTCCRPCSAAICPSGQQANGFCSNNVCPTGFTCQNGTCCGTTTPGQCPSTQPVSGGACVNGLCGTGFSCINNVCCRASAAVCTNNEQANGFCNNNQCQSGFTCINGVCCGTTTPGQCPSTQPVSGGACNNGICGTGFSCINNVCCRPSAAVCTNNQQANGLCTNNQCQSGFTCNNGVCCGTTTPGQCPSSQPVSSGACANGQCATTFSCFNNVCCRPATTTCANNQQTNGFCTNFGCSPGFTCQNGVCCAGSSSLCPGNVVPNGACINGICAGSYTCVNGQCCPSTTNSCPANSLATTACSNGVCQSSQGACNIASNTCCLPPCSGGQPPVAACINNFCATGTTCTSVAGLDNRFYQICCSAIAACAGGLPSLGTCTTVATCPPGTNCVSGQCCSSPRSGRKRRQTVGLLGPLTSSEVRLDMNLQGYDNCVRNCNTQATSTTFDAVCAARNACTVTMASGSSACTTQTTLQRNTVKTRFCSCLINLGISCTPINTG